MPQPNCYECKSYGGHVPGSAHISCNHPSLATHAADPLLQLAAMLGSVARLPPLTISNTTLNIAANEHGVRMGCFNFPFNYDPHWLERCDGFEAKQDDRTS